MAVTSAVTDAESGTKRMTVISLERPLYSILGIVFIFVAASLYLYTLSRYRPVLESHNSTIGKDENISESSFQFPQNLNELKNLAKLLGNYQQQSPLYVFALFCSAYLYKQTFAIPGSVFMNLLAGALYGLKCGLPCVCILTASGASCCFLISKYLGRPVLLHYFPEKLQNLQNKINDNEENLFGFLLFLRFFPMSPNWFLNMASPVLNVPLKLFFPTVLIAANVMIKLLGIAIASLIPSMVIRRINSNRQKTK